MAFFQWLQDSAFSMWVKDPDTLFGYDMYLSAHAVGMALAVGLSAAIALRILGFAPRVPLKPMEAFFPVLFVGFWINAFSGLVLFIIYPVKPITNPGFYVKISAIVLAVLCVRRIRRQVFGNPRWAGTEPVAASGRVLAAVLLTLWAIAITAGRLMAYRGIDNVEREVSIAVALVFLTAAGLGWLAFRFGPDADAPMSPSVTRERR